MRCLPLCLLPISYIFFVSFDRCAERVYTRRPVRNSYSNNNHNIYTSRKKGVAVQRGRRVCVCTRCGRARIDRLCQSSPAPNNKTLPPRRRAAPRQTRDPGIDSRHRSECLPASLEHPSPFDPLAPIIIRTSPFYTLSAFIPRCGTCTCRHE